LFRSAGSVDGERFRFGPNPNRWRWEFPCRWIDDVRLKHDQRLADVFSHRVASEKTSDPRYFREHPETGPIVADRVLRQTGHHRPFSFSQTDLTDESSSRNYRNTVRLGCAEGVVLGFNIECYLSCVVNRGRDFQLQSEILELHGGGRIIQ